MSDGAASCVLRSGDAPSGLQLLGVWQKTNPRARGNDKAASFIRTAKYTADGVAEVTRAALDALHLTPRDVRRFITNNYNHSVLRLFATKSGFTLRDCFLDHVGSYGHVYAADNLMSLDAYAGSEGRPGDTVLALSTGACTWGVAAVRIL
jgi:3-oxoacyl-[acyl-carrier-protein] synthase III